MYLSSTEISHPRRQFNQFGRSSYIDGSADLNNRKLLPSFLKVPSTIEVSTGQTVILSCKVANLDDRMVSRFNLKEYFKMICHDTLVFLPYIHHLLCTHTTYVLLIR